MTNPEPTTRLSRRLRERIMQDPATFQQLYVFWVAVLGEPECAETKGQLRVYLREMSQEGEIIRLGSKYHRC